MILSTRPLFRSVLVFLTFSVASAGNANTLEERMGAALFEEAGLGQLSEAQLSVLTRWIEEGAPSTAPAPAETPPPIAPSASPPSRSPEAQFGEEQLKTEIKPEIPEAITARLKGEFNGWDGKTVFRLDNGQVWQQRVGGRYRAPKRTAPDVLIERGRFGYYLKVIESGRSVGVKRIR